MRSKLLTLFMAVAVVVALAAEFSVATLAYQGNANKAATPAKPKAKKRKKPASHAMAMPTTPQDCLNRLATLAAREPLPAYEGEPMKIINDGLLWTNGKCAVTDQAQRGKLLDVANKWRMKDAAGVRSGLQELGGTASASSDMGATPRAPRHRTRRTPAAAAPESTDTQMAPASGNSNTPRRAPRRRPAHRNSNTANTNS
jgi:hypothetical protein